MKGVLKFASPYVYQGGSGKNEGEEQADVNVLNLHLGKLSQNAGQTVTGDPNYCSNCRGILNQLSKFEQQKDTQSWTCDFCGTVNKVNLEPEELPKDSDLEYIIGEVAGGNAPAYSENDTMVLFCIDTSGSMCVTSTVTSQSSSKAAGKNVNSSLSKFVERGANQRLPNEGANVDYISRLDSVRKAVIAQIDLFHSQYPNKKLGIVTFSDDVQVIGDGTIEPVTITGDKLDNYDELEKVGTEIAMKHGISTTKVPLIKQLSGLEEQGGTALGPALLISVAMAAKQPGSKVIICTDGLANIGLGSMDESSQKATAAKFYDSVSLYAKENGVTVSVITIAGTDCSMENLGKVADITGGDVEIVDPAQMQQNLSNLVNNPVIATNVSVTLVSHPFVTFDPNDVSSVYLQVGNVHADTEIPFKFNISEKCNMEKVPFQLQIISKRIGGPRCVRVITYGKSLTRDRALAERDVDVEVIGVHVSKAAARLVQEGKYNAARSEAVQHKKMLERAVHTDEQKAMMAQYHQHLDYAEEELGHAEKIELAQGVDLSRVSESVEGLARMRSHMRDDRTAAVMYQLKGRKAQQCVVQ